MKKILLAFDGTNFSEGAFEFARELNERKRILLTGVFLPQVDYANLWSYSGGAAMGGPLFIPLAEATNTEAVAKNIERFEKMCQNNDIEYRVHRDFTSLALTALKKETRFADLLIIGSEAFYKNLGTSEPNEHVQDALHGVECPVIIVPEKFEFPKKNILAYDGGKSSVYAIKQFTYLFPEFLNNKTILIYARGKEEEEIPDEIYMEELAARHFHNLTVTKLDINPRKDFATWISESKAAILISGSFGRSSLSLTFKKSFITDVIKDHKLPIFIAHR